MYILCFFAGISKNLKKQMNGWSKEMFLRCKMDLHKLPTSERAIALDILVYSIICCIDIIVMTTIDDTGLFVFIDFCISNFIFSVDCRDRTLGKLPSHLQSKYQRPRSHGNAIVPFHIVPFRKVERSGVAFIRERLK